MQSIGISMIAGNTADTLESFFNWATAHFDEINVVVQPDNYDDTLELCKTWASATDRIVLQIHPFDNFSAQFQRAIDMCTKDWVFQLGADEILGEFPYDRIPTMMDRMKKDVGMLPRFNLQRDLYHYNRNGYPDYQQRLIRMNCGVGMDGAIVDEHLNASPSQMTILEALPMLHFGHIRPQAALQQKGEDRIKFADADACDGPKLKEHGTEWFIKRNEQWDREAEPLPVAHRKWLDRYVPPDSPLRR